MDGLRSHHPRLSELFIISQLAAIRSGQDRLQSSTDRHLVLTGQLLEAIRMGKPTAPPTGRMTWREAWTTTKAWLDELVWLHKIWSVWRTVSWPVNIGLFGSAAAKWLGWL